jgi:AraC-like DNA-binding protein
MGAHRHREAYAALVLSGSYVETGPDGAWRCEAGDLVLHPPFHLHGDRIREGARVLNFNLSFGAAEPPRVSAYAVVPLRSPSRLERAAGRDAASALREAIAEAEARAPEPEVDWCDRVAASLAAGEDLSIGRLAAREGVCAEHVSRTFRARLGVSPARFRAEQGLRRALRALMETDAGLSELSLAAGFADQAHMSRAVKAATGASPGRLRALA